MARIEWDEFRAGLRETQRYVLSHHPPSEWDRCYALSLGGRQYHVCARCLGIYPGILLGLIVYLGGVLSPWHWFVIVVFPVPALIDWWITTTGIIASWNQLRTGTGLMLGIAYGLGLGLLLGHRELWILGVGIFYGLLAGSLLYRYRDHLPAR